jgi:hypothetical protein
MLPYERRTTHEQRTNVRHELHDLIDLLIDTWPAIQEQAVQYGKGFSANTIGSDGGTTSSTSSRTEVLAAIHNDPSDLADTWLTDLTRAITGLRHLHARIDSILPDHAEAEKMRGRINTVENCTLCEQPNPKMKRIDGLPYCATSCYFRVWRTKQTVSAQCN